MNGLKENFNNPHILIVGSGIIGKFNAIELSKLGFQITIVDPLQAKNSSQAALGFLMGNIYQKRNGRSWLLRKKSLELWPIWIKVLQQYNSKLVIEKPLIQLTTDEDKFKKQTKFVLNYPRENIKILNEDSKILQNINQLFNTKKLKGIISYEDGRISPNLLLKTLDTVIKESNIKIISDEITKIKRVKNRWFSACKKNDAIHSDVIVLCNSLNAMKLIDSKKLSIKLKPVLGQAIEIYVNQKEINFLSLPKHFSINGKNFIPKSKDKIIIGSTDEYDIEPKENYINELTEFIDNTPKWLNKNRVSNHWYGIRSQPQGEGSPILKSLEKGLILCSGFYKNGFLLAPACSDWLIREIKEHL